MKQLFIIISLFILLFIITPDALAQNPPNTYGCAWSEDLNKCLSIQDGPSMQCNAEEGYKPGRGCENLTTREQCLSFGYFTCETSPEEPVTKGMFCDKEEKTQLNTAIGCITISQINPLVSFFLRWAIGVAGGTGFILIILSGLQIIFSAGNPYKLKAGKELLVSAISGILLVIFSVYLLRVIGVDILQIPGL